MKKSKSIIQKPAFRIAFCSVTAAVEVVLLFIAGFSGVGTYALPCFAGLITIAVVIEYKCKWALGVYAVAAVLTFLLSGNKEAALMFTAFFGYYPILKNVLDRHINNIIVRWIVKFAVFNAAAVTLVTYFLVPQDVILFGILHFLAVAMIWYGLTFKWREKIPLAVGLISCAVLTFCFAWVEFGKFAAVIPLPGFLYKTNLLFPFGMYSATFYSADYFPILPWIFVFLFGTYLGRLAKAGKFPAFTYKSRVPFLSFIGKHALWIYVLHQPVIILIAWIITRIVS